MELESVVNLQPKPRPSEERERFPSKIVLIFTGLLSLALGVSSVHTYLTLKDLRTQYLESRAQDIWTTLNQSVRGPGRRTNFSLWETVLQESIEQNSTSIRFLALVDASGQIVLQSGLDEKLANEKWTDAQKELPADVFVYLHEMPSGRGGPPWEGKGREASNLVIGLYTGAADSLLRQAYAHLLVSAVTILSLWALALYLIRTLNRFVELKLKQESERHLANLGRMSATLAHEIRNPLGAMKGLTQVVQEQLPTNHEMQAMLNTVVAEAERLEALVTDLLTFARPGQGKIEQFQPVALVREVVELLSSESRASELEIRVQGDGDLEVTSSRDGLRQVFLNVVKNAIEASPQKGLVQVQTRRIDREGWLEIQVQDQGPGFGPGDPGQFFEPFKTTKTKGSGLGLAISRQILEKLGGRILLENNPEGGASVRIRLKAQ